MRLSFKTTDFLIQLIGFAIGLFMIPFQERFLLMYFLVGGWQIGSLLIHWFDNRGLQLTSKRSAYAWTALVTGILTLLIVLSDSEILLPYLVIVLVFTPVLAIWYMSICYREIIRLRKRDLIHLK
ncbi:MAG: hypothetical protein JNJ86_13470 [Chitinophagaceae bacterium]|nr:hypothetical protein [Chitinophagaceae bacterium]